MPGRAPGARDQLQPSPTLGELTTLEWVRKWHSPKKRARGSGPFPLPSVLPLRPHGHTGPVATTPTRPTPSCSPGALSRHIFLHSLQWVPMAQDKSPTPPAARHPREQPLWPVLSLPRDPLSSQMSSAHTQSPPPRWPPDTSVPQPPAFLHPKPLPGPPPSQPLERSPST